VPGGEIVPAAGDEVPGGEPLVEPHATTRHTATAASDDRRKDAHLARPRAPDRRPGRSFNTIRASVPPARAPARRGVAPR